MAWPSERKAYRGELGGDREQVSLSPVGCPVGGRINVNSRKGYIKPAQHVADISRRGFPGKGVEF